MFSEICHQNLPALSNIHLVALFHTEDLRRYGFDSILEPLINDIRTLESCGLDLPFSAEKVYGTICEITADNLGMHAILGFTESFSGCYLCCLCLIDKDNAPNVYNEDNLKVILRGKELFEVHCNELQSDSQKICVWFKKELDP